MRVILGGVANSLHWTGYSFWVTFRSWSYVWLLKLSNDSRLLEARPPWAGAERCLLQRPEGNCALFFLYFWAVKQMSWQVRSVQTPVPCRLAIANRTQELKNKEVEAETEFLPEIETRMKHWTHTSLWCTKFSPGFKWGSGSLCFFCAPVFCRHHKWAIKGRPAVRHFQHARISRKCCRFNPRGLITSLGRPGGGSNIRRHKNCLKLKFITTPNESFSSVQVESVFPSCVEVSLQLCSLQRRASKAACLSHGAMVPAGGAQTSQT